MSASSISPVSSMVSGSHMQRSLAEELDCAFEDIDPSPVHNLKLMESPKFDAERITVNTEGTGNKVPGERERLSADQGQSRYPTVTANGPDLPSTLKSSDKKPSREKKPSNAAPNPPTKESIFVEKLSPKTSQSQPMSRKDHNKLIASLHNRNLIERTADGFFKMDTKPSTTDVRRQTQQAEGIAALQRTLIPAAAASSSPHIPSSTTIGLVKHPSGLRKITFAEPRGRKTRQPHGPSSATARSKAAPQLSLARSLIISGYRKRMSSPSAPARFVRLPSDPLVTFTRNFASQGLKIRIPEESSTVIEQQQNGVADSRASNPNLLNDKPALEFGVPRRFIADQCLETSCPIRWAHAKGPYHHKGHRDNSIMTGLFGHSNPPPEIWNAYRNMLHISRDGELVSPDGRPRVNGDEDLVIAFAVLHFGELNRMSGEEFHRCYAGRHMSSMISLRAAGTDSSVGEGGSGMVGRR